MISVMNNECDFAPKSDAVEEPPAANRVSEDTVDRSDRGTAGGGGVGAGGSMNLGVSDRIRASPEGRLCAVESEGNARVSEDGVGGGLEFENVRSDGLRVFLEDDSGGVDREIESRVSSGSGGKELVDQEMRTEVFEIKDEGESPREGANQFDGRSDRKEEAQPKVDAHELEGGSVSQYESLLSKFDDFVANGAGAYGMGTSRASSHALEVGEMVWGKVKSHPWWPGHIFNEVLADPLVRRTKREGHVLVAFFGDSSFGWFLPDELIPFDSNFAEKSRQTTAKTFLKAVEEAVDEVGRRCGLRVLCQCRNPYTFRPKKVPGYFEVDVPDYETGGIYSADQISDARESFQPEDTLSFVRQLALAPRDSDQKSISWIKSKATVYAYRRAIYEEFDETYAQAFGVQPLRHTQAQLNANRHLYKEPPRAPLSGPLVIAEALGSRKSPAKNVKGKMKKERYLFKRREDPADFRTHQFSKGLATSSSSMGQSSAIIRPNQVTASISQVQASSSSTYMDGPSAFAGGDYVFQKRVPSAPSEVSVTKVESLMDFGGSLQVDQAPACSTHDKKDATWESKETIVSDVAASPVSMGESNVVKKELLSEGMHVVPPRVLQDRDRGQITCIEQPSVVDAKFPVQNTGTGTDGKVKKAKVLKRSIGDLASDSSIQGEKKKKRKKEFLMETNASHPLRPTLTAKGGPAMEKIAEQPVQIGSVLTDSRFDHQTKEDGTGASLPSSGVTMAMNGLDDIELKVSELLSDLRGLALNPYHGKDRNRPQIVMKFFLAFRSLKYEKSLILSPPAENEPIDAPVPQSSTSVGPSENLPSENARIFPSVKMQKPLIRSNDPSKAGRKRPPSDRQEGNALKKLKKINNLKSLAAEKKSGQKTSETTRDGRETAAGPALPKPIRPEVKAMKQDPKVVKQDPKAVRQDPPAKRTEPSAKVEEHTMLLMKFPPRTSLPSIAELKARFARFGPLDHSSTRVFWKSLTCRVVFRYKHDAEVAHRYAVKNNSLFGNVNVKYTLREMEVVAAPELPDSVKGRGEDISSETLQPRDAHNQAQQQQQQQPVVQLKSCLKKSTGDEGGGGTGGGVRGTSRVKFMLGTGEEGHRGEQTMVANRNFNNHATSIADAGTTTTTTTSTSVAALEFNSKNFQKVISPPFYPPPPTLLPQFSKPPHDMLHTEVGIRHAYNSNNNTLTAPLPPLLPLPFPNTTTTLAAPHPVNPPNLSFSHKMFSLMNRAEDIVTRVKNCYGYMPYHPL